jgi:hypothetical protein
MQRHYPLVGDDAKRCVQTMAMEKLSCVLDDARTYVDRIGLARGAKGANPERRRGIRLAQLLDDPLDDRFRLESIGVDPNGAGAVRRCALAA